MTVFLYLQCPSPKGFPGCARAALMVQTCLFSQGMIQRRHGYISVSDKKESLLLTFSISSYGIASLFFFFAMDIEKWWGERKGHAKGRWGREKGNVQVNTLVEFQHEKCWTNNLLNDSSKTNGHLPGIWMYVILWDDAYGYFLTSALLTLWASWLFVVGVSCAL